MRWSCIFIFIRVSKQPGLNWMLFMVMQDKFSNRTAGGRLCIMTSPKKNEREREREREREKERESVRDFLERAREYNKLKTSPFLLYMDTRLSQCSQLPTSRLQVNNTRTRSSAFDCSSRPWLACIYSIQKFDTNTGSWSSPEPETSLSCPGVIAVCCIEVCPLNERGQYWLEPGNVSGKSRE